MRTLRIAMAQIDPTVGDIAGNSRLIKSWIKEARKAGADLVAFPELAVTGYPPEDLLLKPRFVSDNRRALDDIAKECRGLVAVIGYVGQGLAGGGKSQVPSIAAAGQYELSNAAAVVADRQVIARYSKWVLPNYGVFDESRYFHPGRQVALITLRGVTVAINICEDIWSPDGPTVLQAAAGAEVIVNINASPFHIGKSRAREQMLATRAREHGVILTYTNMVGGQDELVFDGNSMVFDQTGEVIARGKEFAEDLILADLAVDAVARTWMVHGRRKRFTAAMAGAVERVVIKDSHRPVRRSRTIPSLEAPLGDFDAVYRALVLGVQDYVRKNGFRKVAIGLSGGIDSALTAVVAVDALGPDNVLGVFMPSLYTSDESAVDVAELSHRIGIEYKTIPITATFESYRDALASTFQGEAVDTTEENLQARIRGNLLMAYSNKFGHLVLTTGNKSEMSVGYATLYGDMAGGFAVIKDVPKTMVYELSRFRNLRDASHVIPKRIIDRPPSAELRPNQKDEDSLPAYAVLDPILQAYVEENRSIEEIVAEGFDHAMVARVVALVDGSEFKRRQAPIGIKVTHLAFGKDRRMPITNGYRNS
jgi:NAD+ synthase (glutamine-hydrolysing)